MRVEAGFRHNGLIVYAVLYELDTTPPSWLIVWLDQHGESLRPWIRPADRHRRMAAIKAGDVILHRGTALRVVGVKVYRGLGVVPGTEVVG